MTVGELLSTISSHELTEWLAFYKIEHDEEVADARRREERNQK